MDDLVSTAWLAERLGELGLVVIDASAHLPDAQRDARAEFETGHIPGARFLDLDSFTPGLLALDVTQELREMPGGRLSSRQRVLGAVKSPVCVNVRVPDSLNMMAGRHRFGRYLSFLSPSFSFLFLIIFVCYYNIF